MPAREVVEGAPSPAAPPKPTLRALLVQWRRTVHAKAIEDGKGTLVLMPRYEPLTAWFVFPLCAWFAIVAGVMLGAL